MFPEMSVVFMCSLNTYQMSPTRGYGQDETVTMNRGVSACSGGVARRREWAWPVGVIDIAGC